MREPVRPGPGRCTTDHEDRDRSHGLTSDAARARLRHDGPNELPRVRRRSAWRRFAGQLTHFFARLLWVAGGLAILAGMPALGVAIFAVVIVNATFSFVQESRADRAAERVRSLLPQRATVRRDGHAIDVPAEEVVVGDVLLLGAGDRVPADAHLLRADRLLLDTSTFTGESVPEAVSEGMVHAGCFVVEGEAAAEVTAIGADTRLAEIARLTVATPSPPTPLARELQRVVRTISVIAVASGAAFFAILLALGRPLADGFTFAVGVTVALVPEALLPTVTLALSWGAEQMAHKRVLVRQLEAVETLGSTTFICTDKTGTLTQNQMAVVEVWTPGGRGRCASSGLEPDGEVDVDTEAERLVRAAALVGARCSSGRAHLVDGRWVGQGDPMEVAIDVFARRMGIDTDADRLEHPPTARHPFDPRRRRMSVVVDGRLLVKGAPDAVLPRCGDPAAATAAAEVLQTFAERGLRILAVAERACAAGLDADPDRDERDLALLGLLAMEDPPRPDVGAALERCRGAGIRVAMITGDHPATAAAIAAEVGLALDGSEVLLGADLPADDVALGELLDRDGTVVARVAPEDKLRIARALRGRGHVVAMTGDGVNDGPALHEADIGIAMGASGTDVAREAADLVLLDDHFASIVDGVELGRATYANVRRFLTYHLTDNVAELTPFVVWALSGGSFPLALGVLQILALDLGTDTLSAAALGAEPGEDDLLDGPPARGRLLDRSVVRRAFGVLGPTVAAGAMAAFVAAAWSSGWRFGEDLTGASLAAASGATFMAIVLAQSANAFACRSDRRWPGSLGWGTNRLLVGAVALELAFSLVVLWVPAIAGLLGHASPPAIGWLVAGAGAVVLLGVDALDKARRRS